MPELPRGSHTIRSHGRRVARIHLRDWLILLLLAFLDGGLNVIEPFHRFVGSGTLEDLKFPLKHNTVPFWAVPLIAVFLPFTVILVRYFIRKDVYDFHQATLGLLFSILITAVMTDSIKDAVGRPRPDFFWRCFPSGKPVFDRDYGGVMCNGTQSIIKEGYKSFPSGHTSWTFAGLVFLALYIAGKVQAFDKSGHVANLCLVFSPILVACLVGVSRIDDYWHHWQDVFAGALLGSVVAVLCYLQFFPPPYDDDGWEPHAYFQTLAESTNIDIQPSNLGRMSLSVQPVVADIQSEHVIEVSTLSSQGNLQDSAGSSSDGPQLMERQ